MSYQEQAQSEMWDAVGGVEPRDTRKRLFVFSQIVDNRAVKVSRIHGTRRYVVAVDGRELPGSHDWTIDALNAGRAAVQG